MLDVVAFVRLQPSAGGVGAVEEQLRRRPAGIERPQAEHVFALDSQGFAARCEHVQLRTPHEQQVDERGHLGEKVFTVVEHEQRPAVGDERCQIAVIADSGGTDRAGDRAGHCVAVAQ